MDGFTAFLATAGMQEVGRSRSQSRKALPSSRGFARDQPNRFPDLSDPVPSTTELAVNWLVCFPNWFESGPASNDAEPSTE
jgi:hypothetical protein